MNDKLRTPQSLEPAAGNGLLNRRIFLEGALLAGATTAGLSAAAASYLPQRA
jgi:sulfane dehydrogenase subunit SoxC